MEDSGASSEKVLELAEEFIERYRRGQRPPLSEYIARYPELAAQIREVFPAMAMIERVAIDENSLNQSTASQGESELTQIGDFRIIREVGRGGMGIVYEAEQVSLGRRVAVKVLPKSVFNRDKVRRRFARESKAAAMLHHTNIVPVFGVGEQDDMSYYVMQFIQGQSLDQVLTELRRLRAEEKQVSSTNPAGHSIRKSPPTEQPVTVGAGVDCSAEMVACSMITGQFAETALVKTRLAGDSSAVDPTLEIPAWDSQPRTDETRARARSETLGADSQSSWRLSGTASRKSKRYAYYQSVARMGVQIADALQHAHQQGIVHRDVKPSNLLLDTHGNVWVTDFGLAKASDQQDLTHTGDVLGTLRYMAPEQFHGKADQRTDIHALGLTLYEMLSLQPAYDSRDRNQLVKQVATESPTPLKSLDCHLPTDLTTIIQKAIDRDPSHRYQSAQELEDDLNRFLNDEPIRARRTSPLLRLTRWSRKNPAIATLSSSVAALLLVVALGSTMAAFRFEKLAEKNANLVVSANTAKEQAQQDRALALVAQNQAEIAQGDAEAARDKEAMLREEAERQRDRANTNANRARRAVDQYLSKITDNELMSVPGLQPLRKDLLNEAMKFYAEFAKEESEDAELKIELAQANFRIGAIHRELGDQEAGRSANAEAIRMFESIRDQGLGGQPARESLAEAYFFAGRYQDAIKLCEQILQEDPSSTNAQSTLAETHNTLAVSVEKDNAKVFERHQKAYEIRRRLVQQHPDSAEFNAELAATINNLGVVLADQDKPHDALAMYELSLNYLDKAVTQAPLSIQWGRWHANSLRNCASLRFALDQQDQSLADLGKLVDLRRRLVHRNPAVSSLYEELYSDLLLLAQRQREMGMSLESNRSYRDAQIVLTQIPRETPEELFELAVVYASLAQQPNTDGGTSEESPDAADERNRNLDLAMHSLQQAVEKGWCDASALNKNRALDALKERDAFKELAGVVERLSEAKQLLASKEGATDQQKLANQQEAAKILSDLSSTSTAASEHARALATTMHALGTAQTGLKQFSEAEKSLNEAVMLRVGLHEATPDDPQLTLDWLTSRMAQGELLWQQRRFPEAHQIWQQCLGETYTLSKANREDRSLQQRIAALEYACVKRYGQAGLLPYVWDHLARRMEFATYGGYLNAVVTLRFAPDQGILLRYLQQQHEMGPSIPDDSYAIVQLLRLAPYSKDAGFDLDWLSRCGERIGRDRYADGNREPLMAAAQGYFYLDDNANAERLLAEIPGWPINSIHAMMAWQRGDRELAMKSQAKSTEWFQSRYRSVIELDWLDEKSDFVKWWDGFWFDYSLWRMAETMLVEGKEISNDPWMYLILARGYMQIGETELAEQKIDAALAASTNPADLLSTVIRIFDDSPQHPQVEKLYDQAVAAAEPNDPLPLIRRGRWYAQTGELAKAEADYAKAAAITPNELNKFLEAGWWVIGPYPSELREFCPPELDPNPAVPLHVIDPKTGISVEPVAWQSCSIRPPYASLEQSKLTETQSWSDGHAYALTHVYSPDERSTSLVLKNENGPVAVWVNGLELDPARQDPIVWLTVRYAPFTLRPGLNEVLVKFSANTPVQISLDDFPLIRAFDALKFAAFQDSAEAFSLAKRHRRDTWIIANGGYAAATAGDSKRLQELCSELLQDWRTNSSAVDKVLAIELLTLTKTDAITKEELATMYQQMQEVWNPNAGPYQYCIAAAAAYRLGRFREAIELGEKNLEPRVWPILAMAHHQLENAAKAEYWLSKSSSHIQDVMSNVAGDGHHHLWLFTPLYREALQLIRGDTVDFDIELDKLLTERSRLWNEQDPLTAAFDRGVVEAPNNPYAYIARGKRLAELGKISQAERDVDRAVVLEPGDVEVLLARAIFLADQGRIKDAADDAEHIHSIGFGDAYFSRGLEVESQIASHGELLEELLHRHPDSSVLHRLEGDRLAGESRWAEAREMYRSGDTYWSHEICAAAISALLQDAEGHADALKRADKLWFEDRLDSVTTRFQRGRMEVFWPLSKEEAVILLADLQSTLAWNFNAEHRGLLGVAQMRAGRFAEAVQNLNSAIHTGPISHWHVQTYLWPAYSMALWNSGDQTQARKYLELTADYLRTTREASRQSKQVGGACFDNFTWLGTLALYHEARALIDGPEAAKTELDDWHVSSLGRLKIHN